MFVLNYYWITIAGERAVSWSLLILWAVLSFVLNIKIWSIQEVAERVIYKVAKKSIVHESYDNSTAENWGLPNGRNVEG